MIDHNKQGAMGVVINKVVGSGPLAKLMEGFGMNPDGVKGAINLHYGGPVDSGVGVSGARPGLPWPGNPDHQQRRVGHNQPKSLSRYRRWQRP
ncbi:MAG: hypothetical protein HN705_17015 [Rhodospirillales bacterium]|nr:hypothetical protein [Rhodospirillales bacterium]